MRVAVKGLPLRWIERELCRYPLKPLGGTQSTWSRDRPTTIEMMIAAMDKAGVDKSAIVQASTAYGHDNTYVAEAIAAYPKRFTGVAFGSVERKGRWRLPRFAALTVFFGDADIDLRTAEIGGRVVTITALLLFGNADFYVPTGVDIDIGGATVFGHRREHGDDEPTPDAPLVRIRVYSLFGTSDVWRIAPETSGSFRELIRSVKERKRLNAG